MTLQFTLPFCPMDNPSAHPFSIVLHMDKPIVTYPALRYDFWGYQHGKVIINQIHEGTLQQSTLHT